MIAFEGTAPLHLSEEQRARILGPCPATCRSSGNAPETTAADRKEIIRLSWSVSWFISVREERTRRGRDLVAGRHHDSPPDRSPGLALRVVGQL